MLVSIEYRLAPHAKLPQIVEDLQDGLAFNKLYDQLIDFAIKHIQ